MIQLPEQCPPADLPFGKTGFSITTERSVMKTYLSLFAAAAVFSAAAAAAGPVDARDMKVSAAYEHSEIYRHEINLLDRELQHLEQDLQWLENKISTLPLMGRPVPRTLHQSVAYKQKRLAVLEKIQGQYRDILADSAADQPDPREKDPDDLSRDAVPSPAASDQETRENRASRDLMDRLQAFDMADWFDILPSRQSPRALVTTLPILFSSGSAVVAKEYRGFFKKISAFVKDRPMYIVVDGFADPDPIKTARYPSNFELGAARAANVIHALTDCGVDPSLFKAATTGKYRFPEDRPVSEEKSMERYVRITLIPRAS
jgi:flagellar motor protein MotB